MKKLMAGVLLFFTASAVTAYAQTDRDALVANALNCVDAHKNSGLTWDDVCDVPQAPNSDMPSQLMDQPYPSEPLPVETFIQRVHTFSFSPEYFYLNYSEPEKAKKISGNWRGLAAEYTFRPAEDSFFNTPVLNYYAIQGLYATGTNTFASNLQRQETDDSYVYNKLKDVQGYMFEGRILVGKDMLLLSNLRLTPYIGVGVRYQTDHEGNSIITIDDGTQYTPINQSNLYYYIPTGLTMDLAANDDYEISWNVEYDYLVKGFITADYAQEDVFNLPAGYGYSSNLRFSLNRGWGGRTSLKFLKHFPTMDVFIEPYVRYWHIHTSKAASGVEQSNFIGDATTAVDKNTTIELGSALGVQF